MRAAAWARGRGELNWVKLIAHPAFPPGGVKGIEVEAVLQHGPSVLTYRVIGAPPSIPAIGLPERTDGLWQRTCFELFVRPAGGEGYFEFNFSPSRQWAAYAFAGYREGMAELALKAPVIERTADGVRVAVDLGGLPDGPWQVGITAVIAEADGAKSFWALAHPGEKPDFHHVGGFVLGV